MYRQEGKEGVYDDASNTLTRECTADGARSSARRLPHTAAKKRRARRLQPGGPAAQPSSVSRRLGATMQVKGALSATARGRAGGGGYGLAGEVASIAASGVVCARSVRGQYAVL